MSLGIKVTKLNSINESITMNTNNASKTPAFLISPFVPTVELMPRLWAMALKIPLKMSQTIKKTTSVIPPTGTRISCEKISMTFVKTKPTPPFFYHHFISVDPTSLDSLDLAQVEGNLAKKSFDSLFQC